MVDKKYRNLWELYLSLSMDKLFISHIGLTKSIWYWATFWINILNVNKWKLCFYVKVKVFIGSDRKEFMSKLKRVIKYWYELAEASCILKILLPSILKRKLIKYKETMSVLVSKIKLLFKKLLMSLAMIELNVVL